MSKNNSMYFRYSNVLVGLLVVLLVPAAIITLGYNIIKIIGADYHHITKILMLRILGVLLVFWLIGKLVYECRPVYDIKPV